MLASSQKAKTMAEHDQSGFSVTERHYFREQKKDLSDKIDGVASDVYGLYKELLGPEFVDKGVSAGFLQKYFITNQSEDMSVELKSLHRAHLAGFFSMSKEFFMKEVQQFKEHDLERLFEWVQKRIGLQPNEYETIDSFGNEPTPFDVFQEMGNKAPWFAGFKVKIKREPETDSQPCFHGAKKSKTTK